MSWGVICVLFILFCLVTAHKMRQERGRRGTVITHKPVVDDEVTIDDMVLHDMQNQDDVWDIGRIDFNE